MKKYDIINERLIDDLKMKARNTMKYGFIGMGNMGQAFLKGMIRFGKIDPNDTCAFAPNQEKLRKNSDIIGFDPEKTVSDVAEKSDLVIIACKPYQIESVLSELGDKAGEKQFVSLAAGWDYDRFTKHGLKIQCIMPNTPCEIGEGVVLVEDRYSIDKEVRDEVLELFSSFSKVIELPGRLIDAGSAISGCAPAFVDVFIEAMADGAVKNGIPRKTAYEIITKMMAGSAKLMEETGIHPGELKDRVCSPGGTTIKGIHALEKGGFRAAVIDAVDSTLK